MPSSLALRWSHHLTLALASLCLIAVLGPFVPELYLYLWPVPFLFLAAGLLREGWTLPNVPANLIGVGFIAVTVYWFRRNLTAQDSLFQSTAFPAILVPYAAVLLMVLTLFTV